MLYVSREKVRIPDILTAPNVEDLRRDIQRYASNIDGLRQQRVRIEQSILDDMSIIGTLSDLFQGRCGYCEQRLELSRRSPLEPHRPLGLAQGKDGRTDQAYYSWLAYDWDNMVAACESCRRRKQNQFFVDGNRGGVNAPVGELRSTETALLLDPCFDDPSEHLHFQTDGRIEPMSRKGEETISVLSLNRRELVDARHEALVGTIERLSRNPRSLAVLPTGAPSKLAAHTFGETEHPGATALALLSAALIHGKQLNGLIEFIDELAQMTPPQRRNYLEFLLTGPAEEVSVLEESFGLPPLGRLRGLADMPAARAPIVEVKIRNFKGLKEIDFRLPDTVASELSDSAPCMILLGENATGKSSVLEAVTLALLGTSEANALDELNPDEQVNPAGLIHRPDLENWETVSQKPVQVDVGFFGGKATAVLAGGGSDVRFEGTEGPSKIVLAYGPRRYFSRKRTRRFRAPAYRARSLFDPMATIPNPADWLRNCPDETFDAAVRALKEILMLKPDDYFAREDGHIIIESSGGRTRFEDMSVGYKSVIAMATDIIRELTRFYDNLEFACATVLIDEIETHLHPRWKMRIMTCLRRAFPQVQFVVTTHDPLCLRGMHDGEVFVLHRREGDELIEKLENLPTIKGMRAEQILTSEFFGLGSTDPETDAKLALYHHLAARADNLTAEEGADLERLSSDLHKNLSCRRYAAGASSRRCLKTGGDRYTGAARDRLTAAPNSYFR
ncbi:AAA family ATPase [Sinorhizobium prairiense]|uniref:AAA family ATPase n=1 Tax=Sinorhizobium sp. C101 TaxID=2976819 RepID=UPI0023D81842|nr:AAA family ATPase [Sinorhizobium sp. C101]WEJ35650.1 AAA family ATPase [Sinorhizobium sp. C101]